MDPLEIVINGKKYNFSSNNDFMNLIRDRYQQTKFRNAIIERDKRCIITGMNANICEACHVIPYSLIDEKNRFNPDNGILLECGLHKLFDMKLVSINPETSTVHFNKKLLLDDSYNLFTKYENKIVIINNETQKYLKDHYNMFNKLNLDKKIIEEQGIGTYQ